MSHDFQYVTDTPHSLLQWMDKAKKKQDRYVCKIQSVHLAFAFQIRLELLDHHCVHTIYNCSSVY